MCVSDILFLCDMLNMCHFDPAALKMAKTILYRVLAVLSAIGLIKLNTGNRTV